MKQAEQNNDASWSEIAARIVMVIVGTVVGALLGEILISSFIQVSNTRYYFLGFHWPLHELDPWFFGIGAFVGFVLSVFRQGIMFAEARRAPTGKTWRDYL